MQLPPLFLRACLPALCRLTRRRPEIPGAWRLVDRLRALTREAYADRSHPTTLRLSGGGLLEVDRHDFLGSHLFVCGEYEPHSTRLVQEILRPGDCLLDVGANIGYFTVVGARRVGDAGRVHAFEAAPSTFRWLEANVRLNRLQNVRLHARAVSDRPGELRFYEAGDDHRGLSSLRPIEGPNVVQRSVEALTLDSLLDDLPTVRLVKIDVEGAELRVLEGMRALLARDRPFLLLELTQSYLAEMGGSAAGLCGLLTERGYHLHRIHPDRLEPLGDAPCEQCNVLAVPEGMTVPVGPGRS